MTYRKLHKRIPFLVLFVIVLITLLIPNYGTATNSNVVLVSVDEISQIITENPYQKKALIILQNKCNTCHRKRNPFLIFKERNMNRRAPRIYKQVFELKRMPKKDGVPLAAEEYQILKSWIESI